MIHIDLLRHGECEGGARFNGHTDVPLTDQGWRQMQAAVADSSFWDGVVTSPLQRCSRFATHLAELHALPVLIEPGLKELHFGDWEGRSAEALMASPEGESLSRFWADPVKHPPPNGESLTAFENRITQVLDALTRRYAGQRLLIVTHAGVIRTLLGQARCLTWPERLGLTVPHASLHHLIYPGTS